MEPLVEPKKKMASRIELWNIARLKPYAKNARTHSKEQVEQIANSIKEFGFNNPILVDSSDGIVAGHGRILGAQKLGLKEVPVIILDHLSDAQRRAYILADNKLAENAGWDEDLLRDELLQLQTEEFDLSVIGFSDDELLELEVTEEPERNENEDEVPQERSTQIKRGDLFQLGVHRLLCGDATSVVDVEKLMDGKKADMVFTDPPYNLGGHMNTEMYSGTSLKSHVELSKATWDNEFDIKPIVKNLLIVLSDNASMYICTSHFLAGDIWAETKTTMDRIGWCIWEKPNPTPSMQKRHWTWSAELICYATKGKHIFNFPSTGHASNVWTFNKEAHTEKHPTQKPISIPEHAIIHSSNRGQIILDLFGGSGSTLIACEKTNRKCFMMEIDPQYCQVIIDRFEKYSGQKAICL